MSVLKYFSIIFITVAVTVCEAEIAIETLIPVEDPESPAPSVGTTPEPSALKVAPLRLSIDLVDGSHVIGVPKIKSIHIQTSYSKINIPLKQISSIKIQDDHEKASVNLKNGDKIKGVLDLRPLELETIFGQVSVDVQYITQIHVRSGVAGRQGLVLHYSFDKNEGQKITDISEKRNNGQVINAKWVAKGRLNGAYEFTGTGSRVETEMHNSLDLSGKISISAWIKISQMTSSAPICSKGYGGGESWLIDVHNNKFRFVRRQNRGASYVYATSAQNIQQGLWYHVVGIADGEKMQVYVNAQKTTGQAYSGPFDTNDHKVTIGSRERTQGAYNISFIGMIDEVMIFNRPLLENEINRFHSMRK